MEAGLPDITGSASGLRTLATGSDAGALSLTRASGVPYGAGSYDQSNWGNLVFKASSSNPIYKGSTLQTRALRLIAIIKS